jgi:2,3-bisphosphoglycerate-dependent phosphoglycerate mutase
MSDEFAPTQLVLIRHGESNATVGRVIGGPRTCTGLSDLGRSQAQALHDRLLRTGGLSPTHLVSSAYPRAVETAETIAPALGLGVEVDAAFGEHDPGPDCDGMSFGAFVERFGTPDWECDPHAVTFPGGETVAEFQLRVGAALSRLMRSGARGSFVIVCHGGVVDVAFRTLLGLPATGVFELHTVNTSITEFVQTRPGRWRLVRYNDAAHLAGLPAETPRVGTPPAETPPVEVP